MTTSALHVGEAALTAAHLVAAARARGLPWDHLPLASTRRDWDGPVAVAQRAVLGATWLARLGLAARRYDIVHVHSASTVAHSRLVSPRYVLHCHGTDVRTAQYDATRGASVRRALAEAEAVLYSTPDLAEHVLPHREDALYLPVPVSVEQLPEWVPDTDRPRVVFASRWEAVKGLAGQLDDRAAPRRLTRRPRGRARPRVGTRHRRSAGGRRPPRAASSTRRVRGLARRLHRGRRPSGGHPLRQRTGGHGHGCPTAPPGGAPTV